MIQVLNYYFKHQGGTKDYYLWIFEGPGGALAVKTFGKIGATGQMKQEFVRASSIDKFINDTTKDRSKNGYNRETRPVARYSSITDAVKACLDGKHARSITNQIMAQVDPNNVVSVTGLYDPLAEDRDIMRRRIEEDTAAQRAAQASQQRSVEIEILKENPMFGMF